MFGIQTTLLEAQDILLGPIDHETHADIESRWTYDADFMRSMELTPTQPQSPASVRLQYTAIEEQMNVQKDLYYFTIRTREEDRFIGKAMLEWIDWTNGNGYLRLGIAEPGYRGRGYGSQTLNLLLSFAFEELGMYRVTAVVPAYNREAIHLFRKFGFMEEVRRRKALYRDDQFWDIISFGLLHAEWREQICR